jgi:type II secretory pathway component GspD/PulD (secretin)
MQPIRSRCTLLATGLALILAFLPGRLTAAAPDAKETPASPAEKIKKQLDQTTTLEIADQPLSLALNQIREQTKINFVIDRFTIQQMGMDPEQMPVSAKLKDVKVRSALRSVLSPYNLGYAIIGDTVLISTDDMVMLRQMRQRVSVDLDKVDLAAALKKLSKETATNLMLDARVGKEAKAEVSLQLEDVPLETAVRLVAEMGGLKPVKVGNVLFVTTKALATDMRNDPDLSQPIPGQPIPGQPVPGFPGAPPGLPVAPGIVPGAAVPNATTAVPGVEVPPAPDKPADPEKAPGEPGDKKPAAEKEKPDKGEAKPDPPKSEPKPPM